MNDKQAGIHTDPYNFSLTEDKVLNLNLDKILFFKINKLDFVKETQLTDGPGGPTDPLGP